MAKQSVTSLSHGMVIEVAGRKYRAGSVMGDARRYGDDPFDAFIEEAKAGNPLHWLNEFPVVVSSRPASVQADPCVAIGEEVDFEGRRYRVEKTSGRDHGLTLVRSKPTPDANPTGVWILHEYGRPDQPLVGRACETGPIEPYIPIFGSERDARSWAMKVYSKTYPARRATLEEVRSMADAEGKVAVPS
jgi:hypothetical protein